MASTLEYKKFFIANKADRSLVPFTVWLPKPPADKYIEGSANKKDNQVFTYTKYPEKLKNLEGFISKKMEVDEERNKHNRKTKQKFISQMWDEIKANPREYKNEIEFIKREQYKLLYGNWVAINGVATWITPWHYRFLNYWTIDDVPKVMYRHRDWEYFIVHDAAYRDPNCFGIIYPKHRRDGATHKSLNIGYSIVIANRKKMFGIQSFDENNAKDHYYDKFTASFDEMKFFVKPLWDGKPRPVGGMNFIVPSTVLGGDSLNSTITYATSAKKEAFDGRKQAAHLSDENGKTTAEDVLKRWGTIKETLAEGNGAIITGFAMLPSTVEEIDAVSGGKYKTMCKQSMYNERNSSTNQTKSGLWTYFSPACNGMTGFFDKFGNSIIEDPNNEKVFTKADLPVRRDSSGKLIGARRYLLDKRNQLLNSEDINDKESYGGEVRRFPLEFIECFGSLEGNAGFDVEKLTKRRDELMSYEIIGDARTVRGNFYWEIETPQGKEIYSSTRFINEELHLRKGVTDPDNAKVIWIIEENGRWEMSLLPTETNQRYLKDGHWHPINVTEFTHSGDPYKYLNKSEMNNKFRKDQAKRSKGGLTCFQERNFEVDTISTDINDWKTNRFVLSYVHRHQTTEEFGEDAIMQMVFMGGFMFPESNISNLIEYIIHRGFKWYLLYMTDAEGNYKNSPGFNTGKESKQVLFNGINTYVTNHIGREEHLNIINDILAIQNLEDMTNRDLFTAAAGALYGSRSRQPEYTKPADKSLNGDEYFDTFTF